MYMQIIKITILGLCVLERLEEKIIVNTENVIIVITIIIIIIIYNPLLSSLLTPHGVQTSFSPLWISVYSYRSLAFDIL